MPLCKDCPQISMLGTSPSVARKKNIFLQIFLVKWKVIAPFTETATLLHVSSFGHVAGVNMVATSLV